jgi:putative component of toxin-antitoxin plasmid stabilization module
MLEIKEYLDRRGRSPFGSWFNKLDNKVAAKIAVALVRIEMGNLSNVKGSGGGFSSRKSTMAPGIESILARTAKCW